MTNNGTPGKDLAENIHSATEKLVTKYVAGELTTPFFDKTKKYPVEEVGAVHLMIAFSALCMDRDVGQEIFDFAYDARDDHGTEETE